MFAMALGGFGIGTTEFVAMGLLPEMSGSLGISEPTAGHVISAYALGVVVGAPVIAVAAARVPRRTMLIALMVAFIVGNLASVLAPSYTTLMVARFVAGLPHGAYFGVAALVAAHLAGPRRRAKAVATVMMGLSVANVIGVPAAAWLGQTFGWRSAFVLVAVIGVVTVVSLIAWIPSLDAMPVTNPITELGALGRLQVWMTLIVGMVGFGGIFAVYSYISTTLTDMSGLARSFVPIALMLFGLGMVVGNMVGGYLADRFLMKGLALSMVALTAVLAVFVVAVRNPVSALVCMFLIGVAGAAMGPALQTRLMDVAADAQTLAAVLNHAAFNFANAFGAWIGGLVIAAGFGHAAPAAVGALLAATGLGVLAVAVVFERRKTRR